VVEQLRLRGYEALVEADEPPPGDAPNAHLIVRFLSDVFPERVALSALPLWTKTGTPVVPGNKV
jgi:hypothetical protein